MRFKEDFITYTFVFFSLPHDIIGECRMFIESVFVSFPYDINTNVQLKRKSTENAECNAKRYHLSQTENCWKTMNENENVKIQENLHLIRWKTVCYN